MGYNPHISHTTFLAAFCLFLLRIFSIVGTKYQLYKKNIIWLKINEKYFMQNQSWVTRIMYLTYDALCWYINYNTVHVREMFLLVLPSWNQILFTCFRLFWNQTKFRSVPNQSKIGKYNLIPVALTRFRVDLSEINSGPWISQNLVTEASQLNASL